MAIVNATAPPLITNSFLEVNPFMFDLFRHEQVIPTAFKVDDDIVLFYDEQVIAGNGDIIISSENDTRRIDIDDASQVAFDLFSIFSTITDTDTNSIQFEKLEYGAIVINLAADLIPDATYTIKMIDGAILDATGNALAGFNDTTIKTVDSTPNLRDSIPYNELTDFRADENLILSFDEEVVAGIGEIVI